MERPHYRFDLIQILPAAGYSAVFAVPVEGADFISGPLQLVSWPCDFLALASVQEFSIIEEKIKPIGRAMIDVVSVSLGDGGSFCIDDEANNFAGILKDGGDIRKCDGNLTFDLIERLQTEFLSETWKEYFAKHPKPDTVMDDVHTTSGAKRSRPVPDADVSR